MANRYPTFDRHILALFFSKIEVDFNGCWVWRSLMTPGRPPSKCYGMFAGENAHRTSYRWFVGPIPEGLHIDHLCCHSWCVNPAHLEAVTQAENNRRSREGAFDSGLCRRGHDVTLPGAIKVRFTRSGRRQQMCAACYGDRRAQERVISGTAQHIQHRTGIN